MTTIPESAPGEGATRPVAGRHSTGPGRRGRWDLGVGDAEKVLAEARKALFVMVGFLAILWIVQIVNWADGYHLSTEYGITTRSVTSLPDILSAPFLHLSWTHIEANSGLLFIFGFLAAYRGVAKFLGVTLLVILTSGIAAWLFSPSNTVTAGASGVVFGYFGYIIVRGFFDRHMIDIILGVVMALCFAYEFSVLLPHQGLSWEGHIGGLIGGIAAGWIFRDHRLAREARAARLARAGSSGSGSGSGSATTTLAIRKSPGASGSGKSSSGTSGSGSREELYKQLDDLGL